jgi:hypothetical protein
MHHEAMSSLAGGHAARLASVAGVDSVTVVASLVHTLGYLATTVVLSSVVYERIGVRVLRRAWINFDLIWGVAMVIAALFAVVG